MDRFRHIQQVISVLRQENQRPSQFDEQALDRAAANSGAATGTAIRILSIVGGLLSALAFLSFVTMSGLNKSALGMTLAGLLLFGLAILMKRLYSRLLTDTFSITFYGLGYLLLGLGLERYDIGHNWISFALILTGFFALILLRHFVFSLVSFLIIHGCILNLILSNKLNDGVYLYELLLALALWFCCLFEARMLRMHPLVSGHYLSLRLAVLLSFLFSIFLFARKDFLPASGYTLSAAALGMGLMLLPTATRIMNLLEVDSRFGRMSVYAVCIAIALCCFKAPAITGSMLALLVCFFVNFQMGVLLSALTLLYGLGQYFYDINLPMSQKSGLLCLIGLIFIGFYLILQKKWSADEKV